ncbi:MAG: GvpL/GvpF family gas vesicle protein [Cyanobacteriota bacterium]|nr:GvpL/GvpF family gas vesicle protein [Cyanobacteriota bacterium]
MAETLYTYAFFPVPDAAIVDAIEQTEGLAGSIQVVAPQGGMIAAAVERLSDLAYLESSDEMLLRSALRHDQVICQLFSQLQVLPLRFGTCFVSREKLQSHLLAKQVDYSEALSSIVGRAEYLLKVFAPSEVQPLDPSTTTSGTAYLLAKKQAYARLQAQAAEQAALLNEIQELWPLDWPRQTISPQTDEILRIYFLLSAVEYHHALTITKEWLEAHEGWKLEWSTALPPYHFVQSPALS